MASDQLNDQELQFKKRARRRLVGAIALVLLMVTILPMVLDDRAAKAPQQEISISIPSQDGSEFTSKVVPVAPQAQLEQSTVNEPQPMQPPPAPIVSNNSQPPKLESPVKVVTPTAPVVQPQEQAAKPATKEVAPVEIKKPQIDAVKNDIVTSSPAPVETKAVETKSTEKVTKEVKPAAANGFSVQIGVFSDVENVKKLQQQLSAKGYKSFTEKLQTSKGEKIRLRAGPFKTREDATAAAGKIKEGGLAAMVVSNK